MTDIQKTHEANVRTINNNFVNMALMASLEYILEKGLDVVIKETAEAGNDLRMFPHVQAQVEEYLKAGKQ